MVSNLNILLKKINVQNLKIPQTFIMYFIIDALVVRLLFWNIFRVPFAFEWNPFGGETSFSICPPLSQAYSN